MSSQEVVDFVHKQLKTVSGATVVFDTFTL
jgi:hypothetical protein